MVGSELQNLHVPSKQIYRWTENFWPCLKSKHKLPPWSFSADKKFPLIRGEICTGGETDLTHILPADESSLGIVESKNYLWNRYV